MTPTPSTSSLSVISSAVGSSLTTGIMEQVSTWRTGGDTDDEDDASLEIYSNPSMHRSSFPSQVSRDESYVSGGSLLNGMEIMPTLHQLQFPQHPLDQPDDNNVFHQRTYSDIMPPPSSTTSSYRRHSMSSHQQRAFSRIKRPSQDDNNGDQFVPSTTRASYHGLTADILARGVRMAENRFPGCGATAVDQGPSTTPISKSGFPSPQATTPSPRVQVVHNFIQPSHSGSVRGDQTEVQHRQASNYPGPARLSPNQLERPRPRAQSRRSPDELGDEDEPMSLSFNGDDEYQQLNEDEDPLSNATRALPRSARHHPYLPRQRTDTPSQRFQSGRLQPRPFFEQGVRDRKGKGRAAEREEEDRETIGKTPVLLNAINTSQTNILSELQNVQRQNQEELAHFREEIYSSLQVAFTRLADQVEGVGRAVVSAETAQQDTVRQLGLSIGSAMGDVFSKMTETIQLQIQQQYQQQHQPFHPYPSRPASIRQASPFPASHSQPRSASVGTSSGAYPLHLKYGSGGTNSRQGYVPDQGSRDWKQENQDGGDDDDDGDDEQHGRGKRRAVERPRSTSESRKTINRPRREFEA
ncbi:hypothetical protein BG011_000464 [Mortierella polycephala]|uniref:Uncharacterized protein n=1 Tax=Mortierella polycephala TaxID=41804 RepID=A0A9P6QJA2_9FUNG|nr:hypothetical protein BG011_000464 [Mortierella polycephala]